MTNICVLGVTCSGKSTYCEKLKDDYADRDRPRPILLRMGRFFRDTIGPDFFAELDSPAAPDATEMWVRNMVWNAQTFAYNYKRDIIIDGFPRTKEQFEWFMLSSLVGSKNSPVEIVYLSVAEGVLESRINRRRVDCVSSASMRLLDARVKKDAALMMQVHDAIQKSKYKYPNLIFKELEL